MNWGEYIKFSHGINSHLFLVILILIPHVFAQNDDDKGGVGLSLSPAMSTALICLISIFFLILFLSLFIRHCTNHVYSPTNIFGRSPSLPSGRGLDPAVVNMYPTFLYSQVKGHRIDQNALECAVCLLEFEDEEILRLLPKCSHAFHPGCIDAWLAFHVTCPLCRSNLVPKPGELISNMVTTTPDHQSNSLPGVDSGSGSDPTHINISDPPTQELKKNPTPNQGRRPPRSTGRRTANIINKLSRSHSTGHLFVQPPAGENHERFTLRLPENIQSQLMKRSSAISSSSSPGSVVLSTARSPMEGYIGTSRGKNYGLFLLSPARSAGGDDLMVTPKKTMMMSSINYKSPLDRLLRGKDKEDAGERSTRKLIPDDQV